MSLTSTSTLLVPFYHALAMILPNLQEIDVSNTQGYHSSAIRVFSSNCPRLEKITWNNTNQPVSPTNMDGDDMSKAIILRELHMDNSVFGADLHKTELSDLENNKHFNIFLFYKCDSRVLERISIRNARYCNFSRIVPGPQDALIKFIFHAPPSL